MPLNLYTSEKPWRQFEDAYVSIRKKEGRLVTDELLKSLPNLPVNHPLKSEWDLRKKSLDRVINFIPIKSSILELGCGNGWMSNQLALQGHTVTGVDVNKVELEQAARVFNQVNLTFAFADVFEWEPLESFEIVVIASAIQYFESPSKLLARLFKVNKSLKKVIISDSPFYANASKKEAINRSVEYYNSNGNENMRRYYYHHDLDDLGAKYSLLYSPPPKWLSRFWRFPPFPIIEVPRP